MSRPYDRKNSSAARVTPAAKDQWYVLHVLSNKERRAVENLKRLFKEDEEMAALLQSEPLVPTEKVEEVRNGTNNSDYHPSMHKYDIFLEQPHGWRIFHDYLFAKHGRKATL